MIVGGTGSSLGQTTGGSAPSVIGSADKKTPSSVVSSDLPLFDPGTSTRGLSTGVTVGGTGSSLGQTTGDSALSVIGSADKKTPSSVVTSDQLFFDTGTSTRGLSTGVTVGGTGSSLVQTTGEAAQRVHLPEVAVTIQTLISPVQNCGPVPVLLRLPVGSLANQ